MIKRIVHILLITGLILTVLLSSVSCSESLHVFKFDTPDNFEAMSVEEQWDWGKENGYLVIKSSSLENAELLDSFLENKSEEKELLIIFCNSNDGKLKNTLGGIYFDKEYYHASFVFLSGAPIETKELTAFHKYKLCGIEDVRSFRHLYLSNDSTVTSDDRLWLFGTLGPERYIDEHYKTSFTMWSWRIEQDTNS